MIYAIRGRLAELGENSAVIEDQSGVSWEMEISGRTRSFLSEGAESGTYLSLYTYLYHREDQMSLYGFHDISERAFFLLLNKVNGVGPRQSIRLLSAASPSMLAAAILSEDESALTALPGIGIKGAKKIILSLKDQVQDFAVGESGTGITAIPGASGEVSEFAHIVEALVQMGFDRRESQRAVKELEADSGLENADEGEVLRRAIVALS